MHVTDIATGVDQNILCMYTLFASGIRSSKGGLYQSFVNVQCSRKLLLSQIDLLKIESSTVGIDLDQVSSSTSGRQLVRDPRIVIGFLLIKGSRYI